MSSTVRDLMTTPVVTARRETQFKELVARVRAARVGGVPVTDDNGTVLGMVFEADLLAVKAGRGRQAHPLGRRRYRRGRGPAAVLSAARLMTSPAVTVRPAASSDEAAQLMRRYRRTSLPVVDRAGRLIGIVGQGDLLDTFSRPDVDIHREIVHDVILRDFVLDPDVFLITVRDGVVTLAGQPGDDLVGQSLAAAVRRVEGVVSVHDRLSYTAGT
jgi:CBS-domain-containing membrane protein